MTELRVTTLRGTDMVLDEATVQGFAASLRGPLLRPDDAGYDAARTVWNVMIDKRPALIVRWAGVADVITCIHFARTNNLLVSVRGGGHNIPGTAVCNGGLVIDLSGMCSVRVDPGRRTARAEGGVKWGEFDHETQAFGLATTGGTDADTGIAGLTLGGGIGWLSGRYGLACDNLISADIVTADGQLRHVNASEHPDLFWAIRGGGGNFGVVTAFEYQLYPVGPMVLAGEVFYPFAQATEFLRFYSDFSRTIPDELNTVGGLGTSSAGAKVGVMAVCYSGPLEEGERVLRPVREFGPPLTDHIQLMPYTMAQRMFAPLNLPGRHNYIKSHFINDVSDEAIGTMAAHFEQVTSPLSAMLFQQLGNAANHVGSGETAFGHRDARHQWFAYAVWEDPEESEGHIRWVREFSQAMRPFTRGSYINQVGTETEEGRDLIREAFGANYQRLTALKCKYDPTNLFRHNQNILPTV
jgi:FAD/FMN-containing dehydrogenase